MPISRIFAAVMLSSLASTTAVQAADLQCTSADKSSWRQPAAIKKMLEQHGFTRVGAIRPNEGNCYVVQARDKTGAKRTLYLDPTDGALMAME
jgi:hypothetical protein